MNDDRALKILSPNGHSSPSEYTAAYRHIASRLASPPAEKASFNAFEKAEGSAVQPVGVLVQFDDLLYRMRGQLADSSSDFGWKIVRDYCNELGTIYDALANTPHALCWWAG